MMSDPFDLQRFVAAQDPLYADVLAELRAGCKRTHWMWFVFPQHVALGHSAMAARYGLASKAEAASCSFKHEFDFDRLIRKLDLA